MSTFSHLFKNVVFGAVLASTLCSAAFAGEYPMDPKDARHARQIERPSHYGSVTPSDVGKYACKNMRSVKDRRDYGCDESSQGYSMDSVHVPKVSQYPGTGKIYSLKDGGYIEKTFGSRD